MKPDRHALLIGSLLLSLTTSSWVEAEPLTEFEQFRSFPYMDRSYREAKKGNPLRSRTADAPPAGESAEKR